MSHSTDTPAATAAPSKVRDAWETTRETASGALETGKRHIREQPVQSIGEALGFGLLLGIAIGWALGRSAQDDYRQLGRRLSHNLRDRLNLG